MVNFITRSGSTLMNGTSPFRFAGCNIYWLGAILPTTPNTGVRYPTTFEVDDALATAVEMGATVVRALNLGSSVGYSLGLEPSLGVFNPGFFAGFDYAVKRCADFGLRLIIPLVDNGRAFHGGISTFCTWEGQADRAQFYTNSAIIADFEAYINAILTRVNALTGVAYSNDPTIMAWETGNELSSPNPPTSWTTTIANYLKSLAPNQLVSDGTYGLNSAALSISNVDLYSNHLYPLQTTIANTESSSCAASSKAYYIGEFDWRPNITKVVGSTSIDNTTAADGTYSCKTVITTADVYQFHYQVAQQNLNMAANTTYTLTFWAKTDTPQTIFVGVQSVTDGTIWTGSQQPVTITSSWAQYSIPNFTVYRADANGMITFNLANTVSNIWIDLVSLTPVSGGANMILNPSFETGDLTSWKINTTTITFASVATFEAFVEGNTNISGDLFWTLMPHNDTSGWTYHSDGYSVYYPGETANQANIQAMRTHGWKMQGTTPAPAAKTMGVAPTVTLSVAGRTNTVLWQGIAGAATYSIQRGPTNSGPWTTITNNQTDFAVFVDSGAGGWWYQVAAVNYDGVAGPYSSPLFTNTAELTYFVWI